MIKRHTLHIGFTFIFGLIAVGLWVSAKVESRSNYVGGALSLEQRAVYQQKIEAVYWRHRVWNNPQPKPRLKKFCR